MYGVPEDLNLAFLHGAKLILVGLGEYQVDFSFSPTANISVEGKWELRDSNGALVDQSYGEKERPPYQLHRLLGKTVVANKLSAPDWFELRFDNGDELRIYDNSRQYESFSIQPGNIFI